MIRILLLLGAALTSGLFINSQNNKIDTDEYERMVLQGTLAYLEQVHFQPKEINDEFSEMVFDLFLERLDYGKRIFTKEDIALLAPYKTNIDDQVKANRLDFFNTATDLWEQALVQSEKAYEEIIDSAMNIHDSEVLELDFDKIEYATDHEALIDRWRKRIEYEVVSRTQRFIKGDEKKADSLQKTENEHIEKALLDTKEMYERYFKNMGDLRRSDHFEDFINCITFTVDPHSNYFSPKKKEDFDIGMSGKLEGIGARLTVDGEYTKVSSVVIGGPAWKDKRLEAKDLILKVAQGEEEYEDVVGWRLDDVVRKIRGKSGTQVRLFVKKEDASTQEITITRDEVEVSEQYAKSYLIGSDQSNRNIGYIDLPRFYADFKKGGRRCAADVKKEIEKLNADSVQGIILDLRSNPGGSLRDVVDISGFFIEKGPIVQAVSKGKKNKVVFDDEDKSVLFKGPLIVMVDQFSASASEIMAAAIQDYGRGLVVGVGGNTYGKGTVQRFYSLDKAFRGQSLGESLGDVKMTIQKYYRINGSSVQNIGVEPDIILPGKFQFSEVGEKEYETAMSWSEIEPAPFSQDIYHFDETSLLSRSKTRVKDNKYFDQIQGQAEVFQRHKNETAVPLDLDSYISLRDERQKESEEFTQLKYSDSTLVLSANSTDIAAMGTDSVQIEKSLNGMKGLRKDVHLAETIAIMEDMLSQGIIADGKSLDDAILEDNKE